MSLQSPLTRREALLLALAGAAVAPSAASAQADPMRRSGRRWWSLSNPWVERA
jgi:hypothetical protein